MDRSEPNPVIWKGESENGRCARLHADGTTVTAWDNPRSMDSMLRQLGKEHAKIRAQGMADHNALHDALGWARSFNADGLPAPWRGVTDLIQQRDAAQKEVGILQQSMRDLATQTKEWADAHERLRQQVTTLEARLAGARNAALEEAAKKADKEADFSESGRHQAAMYGQRDVVSGYKGRVVAAKGIGMAIRALASQPAPTTGAVDDEKAPCVRCGKRRCDHNLTTDTMTWRCRDGALFAPTPPPSPAKALDDTLAAFDRGQP